MGDPEKHPFEFQINQEPLQETGSSKILVSNLERKNPSLKITLKYKGSKTHLQKKDQKPLELKSRIGKLKNHLPTSSLEENKEHTCEECGKSFTSVKSLSGHMRTHPERHWRGIKPPPNFDSTMVKIYDQQQDSPWTSGDSEFDLLGSTRQDFDVLQFSKGWSVTGKRGRITDDELDVAASLLILAKEPEIQSCGIQVLKSSEPPKKRRAEGSEPGIQCKKPKSSHRNCKNSINNADLEELSSVVGIRNLTLVDASEEFNASTLKKNVGTQSVKSVVIQVS